MPSDDTTSESYTDRLRIRESAWWKRLLNVQAPYRWNLQRQGLGRTLDIGCGIGRNLRYLDPGSVGVDHNETSIGIARDRGLQAYTVDEWAASPSSRSAAFDSLLFAHVIEHIDAEGGQRLLEEYLPWLRGGGLVMFICPQERGYASDETHVRFTSGRDLEVMANQAGLEVVKSYSFPFPRIVGTVFTYNEFCVLARKH
ncbi:MAG: methyltransferase domain-containing protein [Microlunatus sp.]